MEFFNQVSFLITGWIFLAALISILIAHFSFLGTRTQRRLSKLEEGQTRLEGRMDNLEGRMDNLETELKEVKANQARLESKLDQLLARKN